MASRSNRTRPSQVSWIQVHGTWVAMEKDTRIDQALDRGPTSTRTRALASPSSQRPASPLQGSDSDTSSESADNATGVADPYECEDLAPQDPYEFEDPPAPRKPMSPRDALGLAHPTSRASPGAAKPPGPPCPRMLAVMARKRFCPSPSCSPDITLKPAVQAPGPPPQVRPTTRVVCSCFDDGVDIGADAVGAYLATAMHMGKVTPTQASGLVRPSTPPMSTGRSTTSLAKAALWAKAKPDLLQRADSEPPRPKLGPPLSAQSLIDKAKRDTRLLARTSRSASSTRATP